LEPYRGFSCDLIVLDRDRLTCPIDNSVIPAACVPFSGRTVYDAAFYSGRAKVGPNPENAKSAKISFPGFMMSSGSTARLILRIS
jgi:hypothetical protein